METTRLRESRAYVVQYTALKASTPFHRPTPKIPAIAIDSTKSRKSLENQRDFHQNLIQNPACKSGQNSNQCSHQKYDSDNQKCCINRCPASRQNTAEHAPPQIVRSKQIFFARR